MDRMIKRSLLVAVASHAFVALFLGCIGRSTMNHINIVIGIKRWACPRYHDNILWAYRHGEHCLDCLCLPIASSPGDYVCSE